MLDIQTKQWVDTVWSKITEKVSETSERIGISFPHVSKEGKYNAEPPFSWIAGFWPGILWLVYKETGNEKLRSIAEQCEQKMEEVLDSYVHMHHDVGFMYKLSAVSNYRITENETSKITALKAASQLAGRFNLKGSFIRAWNDFPNHPPTEGWAIIDCLMNLELLYWASEVTNDPRFKHIAMAHADTALKEFIRPDGSTYHIVCFDPETGARIGARGGQGYAEESAWSRGNSWGIYGMAISYLYTGEERYLQAAKRVANHFVANLPEDDVPYWDFRVPADENTPRDSSAAAIAACGLIELSKILPEEESRTYLRNANNILRSLSENYAAWNSDEEAILQHGTGHASANLNIDVGLIYGDYYFVEAISKLLRLERS
jgi:unsaturated chondroitin disaccharide hydrolase